LGAVALVKAWGDGGQEGDEPTVLRYRFGGTPMIPMWVAGVYNTLSRMCVVKSKGVAVSVPGGVPATLWYRLETPT
jgi:hypothetical protein